MPVKWLAAVFTLFIIGVIVLADQGWLGPIRRLYGFPFGDKAGHLILFGLLTLTLNLALLSSPRSRPGRLRAPRAQPRWHEAGGAAGRLRAARAQSRWHEASGAAGRLRAARAQSR